MSSDGYLVHMLREMEYYITFKLRQKPLLPFCMFRCSDEGFG